MIQQPVPKSINSWHIPYATTCSSTAAMIQYISIKTQITVCWWIWLQLDIRISREIRYPVSLVFRPCLRIMTVLSIFSLHSELDCSVLPSCIMPVFSAFKCTTMFFLMLIITITFPATVSSHQRISCFKMTDSTQISNFVISSSAACPHVISAAVWGSHSFRFSQYNVRMAITRPSSHFLSSF